MQPPASWTGYGWRIPSYREFESPGGNLQTRPLFSASAVWQHEPIMPIFWVLTILRRAAAPTLLAPPLGTPKEERGSFDSRRSNLKMRDSRFRRPGELVCGRAGA